MNTSLVNFKGRRHLRAHISAQPPLVPPLPVLGLCVPRGSLIGRMCLDVPIKMLVVHQPLSTHFQSASQAPGFLPASTRLEARFPYHGSGAMTRSPSPLAWRPNFPGAPREAH